MARGVIRVNKQQVHMLAYYGLRRSELIGLRWSSIDFDHDMIMVNHKVLLIDKILTPDDKLKTKASYRTLPLLSNIKKELVILKNNIEENRKFYGNTYNSKWADYVFVNEAGNLVAPDNLSQTFYKVLKRNNLKKIRLHDLRHSCASLLLASGEINIKQIQDWLGHADYSTTANIYSHLDYGSKKQAASVLTKTFERKQEDIREFSIEELDSIKNKIIAKMSSLGYDDFDKYFNHLKAHKNDIELQ